MNPLEKISEGMKRYTGEAPGQFLLFALLLVLAILLFLLLRSLVQNLRRRQRTAEPLSRVLFARLCRENGLARGETAALRRMAAAYEIPDPALLFFRRSLFESGSTTLGLDAATTEALRQKLFGP